MGNHNGKQGKPRPNREVSITVHFVRGLDDDLIQTLNAVPKGHRATVVKKALRGIANGSGTTALAMPYQMQMPLMPDVHSVLEELTGGMRWVQDALNDLPGYLDRMLAARPTYVPTLDPAPTRETASAEVLQERAAKMKKAKW